MGIEVKDLSKNYGLQTAVNNINFSINTGEVVGFLGPNGAGKSTTMKMITCYMAPSHGEALINGHSILKEPQKVKKDIGYLPENNPLYLDMPIVDYLKFCAKIQGVSSENVSIRIAEMIETCGLKPERHKKIGELSKGYRQRVGLAQAMIHDPEILILDEPTTGLDPNQIVEIRQLIKKLGKEKTVILSSHILSEVEATCDRILIINKGNIVADGSPESLREQAKGQEILTVQIETQEGTDVKEVLVALETVESADLIEGSDALSITSKPNVSSRKAVFNACVQNGWTLLEMAGKETKLEDVFKDLTN